jgi:hypothetical protein
MALSKSEIALYAYITGRLLPKGTTRTAFKALVGTAIVAGKAAAPRLAAAYGPAIAGVPAIPGAAAAAPVVAGSALGGAFLASPPGEALLGMAEQSGRDTRDRADVALEVLAGKVERRKRRTKQTLYNKAVKVGMEALKRSKSRGKPGTINNPKKAFADVNKVASAIYAGKKVAKKGPKAVIGRAVRKILGVKTAGTRRSTTKPKGKGYTITVRK